ncbi:hypothetical protein HELRODRAFT_167498 [Helobdella robusta]|uniref:G-protein coupled receptors family 1 profile domain-containing protein n=1 Tax=Helobdella robusta TaxID=6412 RepID=T1EZF7_HELRO|nr:hypothetical protein HELRODRAFT_167498 [Helobdella robusta]ESO10981.1 hypothetical protein HELRODRAFT_167498 [Helobdella robusta]
MAESFIRSYSTYYWYMLPILYVLRMVNVWLTVMLTVDRYLAVCKPFYMLVNDRIKKTHYCFVGIVLFSIVFSIPRFFEAALINRCLNWTNIYEKPTYTILYVDILFTFFQYFLPGLIMSYLNTRIIITLKKSNTYRLSHMNGGSFYSTISYVSKNPVSKTKSHSANDLKRYPEIKKKSTLIAFQSSKIVTKNVSVVVCICVVCLICNMTAQVMYSLQKGLFFRYGSYVTVCKIVTRFSNILVTFNSASNFVVFCLCSKHFRTILKNCLMNNTKVTSHVAPKSKYLSRLFIGLGSARWISTKMSSGLLKIGFP